ncbi:MAG: hypothetical protein HQL81_09885 [Magnetococcales bacterium]|nr:hypothetical protein [Magnetococcales bacterium]
MDNEVGFNGPRSSIAIADPNGAHVLAIDAPNFIDLVSQRPEFALVVPGVMANRLRHKNAS